MPGLPLILSFLFNSSSIHNVDSLHLHFLFKEMGTSIL
eukprot:UN06040